MKSSKPKRELNGLSCEWYRESHGACLLQLESTITHYSMKFDEWVNKTDKVNVFLRSAILPYLSTGPEYVSIVAPKLGIFSDQDGVMHMADFRVSVGGESAGMHYDINRFHAEISYRNDEIICRTLFKLPLGSYSPKYHEHLKLFETFHVKAIDFNLPNDNYYHKAEKKFLREFKKRINAYNDLAELIARHTSSRAALRPDYLSIVKNDKR